MWFCVYILQPDAEYFKIDLPNSGEVILSKSLDYETKTQLTVTIHASVSYLHFRVKVKVCTNGIYSYASIILPM